MATPQELMQIGRQLVGYCNNQQEATCLSDLYAADAVSVEAAPMPGQASAEAQGLDAIRAKHDWWSANHDVHGGNAEGPFVHGDNRFSVIFDMDVTSKQTGERQAMREVAQYFVADGKIVREEFSYAFD